MLAKMAQKLNIQDKLGIVTVKNTFCDQTDLSFSFQSSDI